MAQMKPNKKNVILMLVFIFVAGLLISCGTSQYRNYKKVVKHRTSQYGYRSNYQKKLKRNTMPVNRNYIIKNKRTQPAWR